MRERKVLVKVVKRFLSRVRLVPRASLMAFEEPTGAVTPPNTQRGAMRGTARVGEMIRNFKSAMPSVDAYNLLSVVKSPELTELVAVRHALEAVAEFEVVLPVDLDEAGRRRKLLELEAVISTIALRAPNPAQRWRELVDALLAKFITVCKVMD